MTKTQEIFISLLSDFLNEKVTEYNCDFSQNELFSLAKEHNLSAVVGFELEKHREIYEKLSDELKKKYKQSIGYTIQHSAKADMLYSEASEVFFECKIPFTPVKGCVIKELYPIRDFRTSGDVDFITEEENIEKLKSALIEKGFSMPEGAHTPTFSKHGCHIELHTCFEGFNEKIPLKLNSECFCEADGACVNLTGEAHLVYMLSHIAKHFRHGGAGIRMLADIDCVIRKRNVSEETVLKLSSENGLEEFSKCIFAICAAWFNTPFENEYNISKDSELYQDLESVILNGGTFGFSNGDRGMRRLTHELNNGSSVNSKIKFKAFLKYLFPPRDVVRNYYSYSKKHPSLIPVAYLHRALNGVSKNRKTSLNTTAEIFSADKEAERQNRIMKELNIK